MEKIKEQSINGKHLYYAFIAGGKQVLQNQNELNQINVFPVSDKDTGTNLASTIRSVTCANEIVCNRRTKLSRVNSFFILKNFNVSIEY